uniref:Uncharacterized protein n=1 Tax=Romanomermis culicivorax TaxID=13658 RepID=A0A915I828_ROMCU
MTYIGVVRPDDRCHTGIPEEKILGAGKVRKRIQAPPAIKRASFAIIMAIKYTIKSANMRMISVDAAQANKLSEAK